MRIGVHQIMPWIPWNQWMSWKQLWINQKNPCIN